jgi:hypothetical protein
VSVVLTRGACVEGGGGGEQGPRVGSLWRSGMRAGKAGMSMEGLCCYYVICWVLLGVLLWLTGPLRPPPPPFSPPNRTKVKCRVETINGSWVEKIPAWIKWATQVRVTQWLQTSVFGVYVAASGGGGVR